MSITAYHFWSPTCAPCNAIKPSIEDLKEEFPSIIWVSVNTHDDKEGISSKYGVTVVPTIAIEVFDNDKFISLEKHSGTNIAGYYRIIRSGLRTIKQL
uniref:Thioredoxin domain-containing protein n=1 Tax=viral metagenome TaxID=1070528 RepID=A0A6C0JRT4_9ZZZZ